MRNLVSSVVLGAFALLLATGCATTIPQAKFSQPFAPESRIAAGDEVNIAIDTAPGIRLEKWERERLTERLTQKINDRQIKNSREGNKKSFVVALTLTRYERGDTVSRMMLAGLGQIHVDGEVTLLELPERNTVARFSISKTFAWGGMYGVSISTDDIEQTFADGVAAALTGQKGDQKR